MEQKRDEDKSSKGEAYTFYRELETSKYLYLLSACPLQVTGELSNNGQPMRRFMQTFVLAPQSPKKYYVHNDIFRYQDEVFHDNDTDTENPEDTVGKHLDAFLQKSHHEESVEDYFSHKSTCFQFGIILNGKFILTVIYFFK